ncbi:MAG: hypothetical protein Kow0059_19040 [Candidatus Sumerlaeia bacterium]
MRIAVPEGLVVKRILSVPEWAGAAFESGRNEIVLSPEAPGRGTVAIETAGGSTLEVRVAAFREREAFLITALSCNMHEGWNPSLHDRLPHPECCGPDKRGHAFPFAVNMERILHGAGLPITWMIDPPVAREHLAFFAQGRRRWGDEIAFMPSSASHFNPVNFNTERSQAETLDLLRAGVEALESLFGVRVTTIAIDQFIGSVGTHFTHAAAALGANALWGVGFEHLTCDTSMFHGGCPWNPYRPRRSNFRVPGGPADDPLPLWIFQWTFRDIVNTLHVDGPARGSTMFSTDVDDILLAQIDRCEPRYFHNLAGTLLANRRDNDVLVMTIHQEDHDSWHKQGLDFYARFFNSLPEGLTPATMGEVAAWLDLKFPHPAHPAQVLRLDDPLPRKGGVHFAHPDTPRPPDWPPDDGAPHPFPPHVCFYNERCLIICVEGRPAPLLYYDYRRTYDVPETGVWPQERLPRLDVRHLDIRAMSTHVIVEYDLNASAGFRQCPVVCWTNAPPPREAIAVPGGFVIFIDLHSGPNHGIWRGSL